MINQKEKKVYNLALRKLEQDKIEKSQNRNNLQTIAQIPESKSSHQILENRRSKNIFQQDKYCNLRALVIGNNNNYNILCKKQFETFKSRIKKLKNNGVAPISRIKFSESFLSSCRNTGTLLDIPSNNGCLSKEQLEQFYTKLKNKKTQIQGRDNGETSYQSQRYNNSIPSCIHKKHQKYKNSWEILNNSTQRLRSNATNAKLNIWSRGNSLQNHRKKVEQLINLSLKSEKQNIQPIRWVSNLRNPEPLKSILQDKYIELVDRQGIRVRGENKLDKQYHWINEKKINNFEAIDNKSKLLHSLSKNTLKQKENKGLNFILQNMQNRGPGRATANTNLNEL